MSRGLGKAQKRILKLLGTKKWKSVLELTNLIAGQEYQTVYGGSFALDKQGNKIPRRIRSHGSDYIAIYQAIKRLERRGLVEIEQKVKWIPHTINGNWEKDPFGQYGIERIRKVKC